MLKVETCINRNMNDVYEIVTDPFHILKWNISSKEWSCPYAETDLKVGGKFFFRMEMIEDNNKGFDLRGIFTNIIPNQLIEYKLEDNRNVKISLTRIDDNNTNVIEEFDPVQSSECNYEMQKQGCQSILDNLKLYAEKLGKDGILVARFTETINAPVNILYTNLTEQKSYQEWTKPCNPTSRYEGSWNKGSKIKFLGEQENKICGMVSKIRENIKDKFISIEHLGFLEGEKEITEGGEVENWKGMLENYKIVPIEENKSIIEVRQHVAPAMKEFMFDAWPKMLKILKQICEKEYGA